MKTKLIRWLIFGVIFSLLPFAFSAFQFFGLPSHPPFQWYLLWPRGELLLVSVGFAADAVGEALAIPDRMEGRKTILIGLCTVVSVCGVFGYGQMQSTTAAYNPILI